MQIIADTLNLTHRGETVLDAKGQTIYRARPYYYVFEQITRERVERGELLDDAPKRLIAARTPVVVESHWLTQATGQFVSQNYVSVGSVLVLGKRVALIAGSTCSIRDRDSREVHSRSKERPDFRNLGWN